MAFSRVPLSIAELLAQASSAVADDVSPFEELAGELDAAATSSDDAGMTSRLLVPVGRCLRQICSEAWPSFSLFQRLCERLCQASVHKAVLQLRPTLEASSSSHIHPVEQLEEVDRLALSLLCHTTASSSVQSKQKRHSTIVLQASAGAKLSVALNLSACVIFSCRAVAYAWQTGGILTFDS